MNKIKQYREHLIKKHGFVDESIIKKRFREELKDFNPFTGDPNCKNCKKKGK